MAMIRSCDYDWNDQLELIYKLETLSYHCQLKMKYVE